MLRTDVHALKILDRDIIGGGLVHQSEEQEKIPEVDTDLDAVGVPFPIICGVVQLDLGRLLRLGHTAMVP